MNLERIKSIFTNKIYSFHVTKPQQMSLLLKIPKKDKTMLFNKKKYNRLWKMERSIFLLKASSIFMCLLSQCQHTNKHFEHKKNWVVIKVSSNWWILIPTITVLICFGQFLPTFLNLKPKFLPFIQNRKNTCSPPNIWYQMKWICLISGVVKYTNWN